MSKTANQGPNLLLGAIKDRVVRNDDLLLAHGTVKMD